MLALVGEIAGAFSLTAAKLTGFGGGFFESLPTFFLSEVTGRSNGF